MTTPTGTTTTITEALAEIKTIEKRLEKKRGFVVQYLVRQQIVRDPLRDQGGSQQQLAEQMQAIKDLEERIIALRRAIAKANATVEIVLVASDNKGSSVRTIGDWLTWRREIAPKRKTAITAMITSIAQFRQKITSQGGSATTALLESPGDKDFIVNVDERALATEAEWIEEVLGLLDGKLSLTNATTQITV